MQIVTATDGIGGLTWGVSRSCVSIAIGCMRFTGRDYKTLRRWALADV